MSFLKEFKEFAVRGNVLDMAIGVIIGGAFGKVVSSFLNDLLMPVVGRLTGGVDFSDMKITIKEATDTAKAVTINHGTFITILVDFVIVAFAVFLLVKTVNSLKKAEAATPVAPPSPPPQEVLLTEIRDLLKKNK